MYKNTFCYLLKTSPQKYIYFQSSPPQYPFLFLNKKSEYPSKLPKLKNIDKRSLLTTYQTVHLRRNLVRGCLLIRYSLTRTESM